MKRLHTETELVRMILLMADTQDWLDETGLSLMECFCPEGRKLMKGKLYRLGLGAFGHILERHWYGIQRFPGKGKFTIAVTEIVELLKMAAVLPIHPVRGSCNYYRRMNCELVIGIDKMGNTSSIMTVITDEAGAIVTAFPGELD